MRNQLADFPGTAPRRGTRRARLAGVIALSTLLCLGEARAAKPMPARDWSRTLAATPEGGFRMGNPNAKVKLVEYGSLSCSHCRHFEETGYKPLVLQYVRSGQVSYEFRNYLLGPTDISASLLVHCAGPSKYYAMTAAFYETQPLWLEKFVSMSAAKKAEIDKMPDTQSFIRVAEITGIVQIPARFGFSGAQTRNCLKDPAALNRLLTVTAHAKALGIMRTPTFLIDGKVTDAATWEQLEPLLKNALGAGH